MYWPNVHPHSSSSSHVTRSMEHQNLIAIQAGVLSIGIFILFINMVFDILGFFIDPLRRRENYARG